MRVPQSAPHPRRSPPVRRRRQPVAAIGEPDAADVDDPEFGPLPARNLDESSDEERDALSVADAA